MSFQIIKKALVFSSKMSSDANCTWRIYYTMYKKMFAFHGLEEHINACTDTLTNFSTLYLVMCKVYTDVGGIK